MLTYTTINNFVPRRRACFIVIFNTSVPIRMYLRCRQMALKAYQRRCSNQGIKVRVVGIIL